MSNTNDAWSSNTTLAEIAAWLKTCRVVVLVTHVKPDGDAVGSTIGVARALARLKINAVPWYVGPMPDWLPAVANPTKHRVIDAHGLPPEAPDGVLVLDTGSWTQLHDVADWLRERHGITAVIDHHAHGEPDVAPRRWIESDCASVCQPAAELCRLLLGKPRLDDLPRDVAEPLYLGVATDTGWFRHSNVSPRVFRDAASLLAAGADHPRLYEAIEQQNRASRLALMARALASLEMLRDGRAAVMTLTLQDFHDSRAAPTDSGGFVDLPLTVTGVMVSVVITEAFTGPHGTNVTKISIRSKEAANAIDANALAQKLGGGGHIRAAGAKMPVTLAEAKKRVYEVLP
ncbi:MAG: DHH family phosphoesterase [Phycisphaerales bacterium]